MVWSKPAPSKDWPMHEALYDFSKRVGKLIIRKQSFERAERGQEHFTARGFVRVHDVAGGVLALDKTGNTLNSPSAFENAPRMITVKVEYNVEEFWKWIIASPADLVRVRQFPNAWWLI
jgi:hypothetical protein